MGIVSLDRQSWWEPGEDADGSLCVAIWVIDLNRLAGWQRPWDASVGFGRGKGDVSPFLYFSLGLILQCRCLQVLRYLVLLDQSKLELNSM